MQRLGYLTLGESIVLIEHDTAWTLVARALTTV